MLAITTICTSCRPGEMEDVAGAEKGMPAVIRINVQAQEQPDMLTRAVDSNVINDLHVLVYDGNGELIGQNYQPTAGGTVTVKTHKASACTIYAVANTGDPDFFKGYDKQPEKSLTERICTLAAGNGLDGRSNIPMTGMKANVNIEAGSQSLGNLEVARMAAKVTLNIAVAPHSGITIKDYTIRSLPLKSYYIPRPLPTENNTADTNAAPGDDASKPADNTHWADGPVTAVNAAAVSATFHMFENRRGVVNGITQQKDKIAANAPARTTYVEINGTAGNVAASWRVYLGADNTGNFNIKRNCTYTYNITLNDAVTADTRVTLDLTKVTDLSAAGTANCYIASQASTWYKFKATVRGNGAATAALISPTGNNLAANAPINPAAAELLWEAGQGTYGIKPRDIIQMVLLQNGYIYFKTGHVDEGNAVIAAKDATGTIIWSWHIWKTHFDSTTFNTITQDYKTNPINNMNYMYYNGLSARNLKMMDRNLGAATNIPSQTNDVTRSFGLYYQFGRKDPFPPAKNRERKLANNSEIVDVFDKNGNKIDIATLRSNYQKTALPGLTIAQNITNTIANPMTFIIQNDADNSENWIYGATVGSNNWKSSNKLWGGDLNNENNSLRLDTKFTGKTIYDPCPPGWCVPPQDTWTNFVTLTSSDNSGNYNVNGLWPMVNGIPQEENTKYFNCVNGDKINFTDGEGAGFITAPTFGRRFYINGTSGLTSFWPAGGERSGKDGKITDVGLSSAAWSSAPIQANSTHGNAFKTTISAVIPLATIGRANAFPVRCVQEKSLK